MDQLGSVEQYEWRLLFPTVCVEVAGPQYTFTLVLGMGDQEGGEQADHASHHWLRGLRTPTQLDPGPSSVSSGTRY